MSRSIFRVTMVVTSAVLTWIFAGQLAPSLWAQAKKTTSDSVVKVSAKGSKIDADGKQTVTITLQIEKGWHLYANPVGEETFKPVQTVVTVTGKEKLKDVKIEYPAGKATKDKELNIEYNVYEDNVEIKAQVQRAKGDTGPLEVSVKVQACTDKSCLAPGNVKVAVEQ